MKKKLAPWWKTYPREYWESEDVEYALRDGWKPTPPRLSKTLDAPPTQPAHLVPTWSPVRRPKRVGTSVRGRAVDQILFDLGIR